MTCQAFDLVIRNAHRHRRHARAAIRGRRRRLAATHRAHRALAGARGETEIDAAGKIVAPGFIDAHTHDDRLMLSAPEMAPKVSQGVTTVVAGNCGISLAPCRRAARRARSRRRSICSTTRADGSASVTSLNYVEALSATPAATNARCSSGHTTLRVATMDDVGRPARGAEIAAHARHGRDEASAAGAIGVSTGLYYEPARAAPTEEVIEICRPLARARRALLHAHARRGRSGARVARGDASASGARSACRS